MPRKDRRYREDPDYAKKAREYQKERYIKEHPNAKRRDSYCDFETHREFAMNSGIQSYNEWRECFKLGLMPDGIYSSPDREFRRNGRK